MITNTDIKKLKNIFATKDDLKLFATKNDLKNFATKEDIKRFASRDDLQNLSDTLIKEITEFVGDLYKKLEIKIEQLSNKFGEQKGYISNHERRIEKLEETVCA